jgi:16S rRNA (uracil1498-N3)-methyltransferase
VSAVNPGQLEIDVLNCEQEAEPTLRVTLVQALAKGDRDELAIQAATELGIMNVVAWQAENSISRWEGAKIAKSLERWQTIVGEAAKQALRAFEPKVLGLQNSKQLSDSTELPKRRLVLDPTSPVSLVSQLPISGDVAILVGPEGGISPSELQAFEAAGFERVHLGSSILRTSTAGIAAVAALFAQSDSWR